jgi:asparagine synthase (glutamine-hydrolysing)
VSGIAGILSPNQHDLAEGMIKEIGHRGTSPIEVWSGSMGALAALGIAESGELPCLHYQGDDERAIAWDGSLFNEGALREELDLPSANTASVPEIVLRLYEELGTRCASRLDGHFSMALVDGNRMMLARDRLGVRPLYYGFRRGALCVASEIKAMTGVVEKVHEFPPGHFLLSDWGLFPYSPYYPEPVRLDGAQESAARLKDLLDDAVERCLPAGIPVGVWLSGGVDSSVVAALARRKADQLLTFSAGVEGAPDLECARHVAEFIGTEHHERSYTLDDLLAILGDVIYHLESFDAPLVRSALGNYLVAELAASKVRFVLSGEGGDELFAGYAYQKDCSGDVELTLSVQDAISALHNTALQRVDRSAAAHTSRVGMPFLDPRLVRYALAIPSRWKIRGQDDVEKWPLRQALVDELPDSVIWRGKAKFWEGAGTAELLAEHAEAAISDEEFEKARDLQGAPPLRSKEEMFYYRIFRDHFGDHVPLDEVGRTRHV